jgi:hypothetical protein
MRRAIVAVGLIACATGALYARDFGTAGGFDIVAQESDAETPNTGACIMSEEYEGTGDTELSVVRSLKNPALVAVIVTNYNWSIKDGEEHQLSYHMGGYYYDRVASGYQEGIRKGFTAVFPADDFLPTFAKSTNFRIKKGDTTVDSLSLDGSSAAVQAFNRCWAYVKNDEAAKQRERDRFSHIPKDPFK